MMRRFLFNTTVALVAVIGLAGSAFAQEFTFRFQSSDPAGNPNFEYQKGWTDLVAERSGGKVKIEIFAVCLDERARGAEPLGDARQESTEHLAHTPSLHEAFLDQLVDHVAEVVELAHVVLRHAAIVP